MTLLLVVLKIPFFGGGDFFEPLKLGKGPTSNHQLSSLGWENSEGAGWRMMLGCFNCSL